MQRNIVFASVLNTISVFFLDFAEVIYINKCEERRNIGNKDSI